MAKTILQNKCPFCGKLQLEISRDEIDGDIWLNLQCGHTIIKEALKTDEIDIVSSDGRSLFPFQKQTVSFVEDADCNALVLHEQGLGKTVIECALLMRNPDLLPALIVVKSGLRAQWFAEVFRWTGHMAQIVTSSKELPYLEMFDIVIVSIDMLRLFRADVNTESEEERIQGEWEEANGGRRGKRKNRTVLWTDEICSKFKHICIDEIQKVKNPGASRTQALRKIVSAANGGNKARVVGLSGTPIDKHAGEYFVGLNLIRPELFPSQAMYTLNECEVNPTTGKIGGLKNVARFREKTKDFIIRFKREEVLPDLPRVFRSFRLAEMEGGDLEAYIKVVKQFQEYMDDDKPKIPTDILGYLSKMRHITGVAKVNAAVDFTEEFLESNDRKLVIFLHHKQVAAFMVAGLTKLCGELGINPPLNLSADLNMTQRSQIVEDFAKPENRLLIASTLASAEGLNLQFCSDCVFLERQWNPTIEEQGEGRFPRPGQTADKIHSTYIIAAGTVDDFLTDIVETKRRNVTQTLDGRELTWDERSLQSALVDAIMTKGLRKWKLS